MSSEIARSEIARCARRNNALFAGFDWLVNHVALASAISLPVFGLEPLPKRAMLEAVSADLDDAALLARAVAGSEHAWQLLFDRWKKPLLAFFYRSLASMPEAEDLTLEVFVRLHRAGSRYEPRAAFATYLFHIARNLLLNELRRRRRKPQQTVSPETFDYLESTAPESERRAAELEEVFQRSLAALPESQRTLLLLVQQQGLEQPVVAKMLAITENALRVQLHRARQRLKELMSKTS